MHRFSHQICLDPAVPQRDRKKTHAAQISPPCCTEFSDLKVSDVLGIWPSATFTATALQIAPIFLSRERTPASRVYLKVTRAQTVHGCEMRFHWPPFILQFHSAWGHRLIVNKLIRNAYFSLDWLVTVVQYITTITITLSRNDHRKNLLFGYHQMHHQHRQNSHCVYLWDGLQQPVTGRGWP